MSTLTRDDIVRLSPPERLALIGVLWDSIADDQAPLTAAQRTELDRRLASFDDDAAHAIEWSDVRRELEARAP
jgi:putative addiction module component (TIGR02574 family)